MELAADGGARRVDRAAPFRQQDRPARVVPPRVVRPGRWRAAAGQRPGEWLAPGRGARWGVAVAFQKGAGDGEVEVGQRGGGGRRRVGVDGEKAVAEVRVARQGGTEVGETVAEEVALCRGEVAQGRGEGERLGDREGDELATAGAAAWATAAGLSGGGGVAHRLVDDRAIDAKKRYHRLRQVHRPPRQGKGAAHRPVGSNQLEGEAVAGAGVGCSARRRFNRARRLEAEAVAGAGSWRGMILQSGRARRLPAPAIALLACRCAATLRHRRPPAPGTASAFRTGWRWQSRGRWRPHSAGRGGRRGGRRWSAAPPPGG